MKLKVKKKNLIRLAFILLLVVSIGLVSDVLSIKSKHGIDQKEGLYHQPPDTIDVVMMGSSHIHCNVNTGLLWEKYGIAGYDYSGAEQPLWMTYFYLKELYKYQNPKVIVLDLYAPARYKEDYQYNWIAENIYGMRFSSDKLEMLMVSVEPDRILHYFPSFAIYHSRYDELEEKDFHNFVWDDKKKENFKGYTPHWNRNPQIRPEGSEKKGDGLTEKSEMYLYKIIDYAKEQGSELILMAAPYVVEAEDRSSYEQIAEIAAKEDIRFIDFNHCYDEMGLDFERDFNDDSHLNYWGSCKFTDYLGKILDSYVQIPDRRGDVAYLSWEENARMIREELKSFENGTMAS